MCVDRKIHYSNARSCQQGIKVLVPSAQDYRDLSRALIERKSSFHTYSLSKETPTRVVIRRVPKEIPASEVMSDLISQGVPVQAVHRLHKARGRIETWYSSSATPRRVTTLYSRSNRYAHYRAYRSKNLFAPP
ncbi:hypothetical protein PYW08_012621 [Mythimna loreyi]|uniref:Uncharacterized protein n=4 Tax=Mythimna loreyi TaxID=667449 RepID=A0ACC2Q4A7_9NEOP|nr:hypothetical protein PYW08_012594 [Mythimna loreyi]KAJ8705556.1 hypothetical protein PYW08_012602 [Mythimna loreyi]KAJ8705569.1 hypothetical protein PYW08_012615 [Mythimna loreyi]KAJ8705575.1 hypothetical protein PYW08_012621 [Mythimna loreyi]